MKKNYRQIAVRSGLVVLLAGSAFTFSSCKEQTVENSSVSETSQAENVKIDVADISDPYEAEGMNFSVKSGFYDSPFYLEISVPEGSTVYYTLDGSVPDTGSSQYTDRILITDRSDEAAVLSSHTDIVPEDISGAYTVPEVQKEKATVVRAVVIDKNGSQSKVVTNTYFVGDALSPEKYKGLKIISLVTSENYLFDHEKGIYVMGKTYDDWKNSDEYDYMTEEWNIPANYSQKGREWEKPAAIQIFEDGKPVITDDVGIRIHGGATRSYPQKSFNIYFRKDYGSSKLEYDLFSGNVKSQSDGSAITEFDTFMLRNGGNDAMYTRFRDKLAQSLVSHRDFLTQGMEPCIVYLDGEYWGHYEITEKLDRTFVSAHFGVPKKEICIIKKDLLDSGSEDTFAEWSELKNWIKETDFSSQSEYEKLCELVDMKSYMEYVSAEIYIDNANWGSSNSAMWKAEKTDENNPFADGKWRFIMFDTEFSSAVYDSTTPFRDTFASLLNSNGFVGMLFKAALNNETFKEEFSKTFIDVIDNDFADERVASEIDRLEKEYCDFSSETISRFWGNINGMDDPKYFYSQNVGILKDFYAKRRSSITKHLSKYLG